MDIVARVREIAQPLARAEGVELLDVKFSEGRNCVLQLTIERNGGSTSLADCEAVSRAVDAALDVLDFIPHRYLLEVSSSGLTRRLHDLADIKRNVGRLVRVTPRDNHLSDIQGTLAAADETGLTLVLADGTSRLLSHSDVACVRRDIAFNTSGPKGSRGIA